MIFDLTRLNNNIDKNIVVDLDYTFSNEELAGTDLLECNIKINGYISKNSLGNIILDLSVNGVMVMPCAITLKPVEVPLNVEINGNLEELTEKTSINFSNTLDIFPIIWENILMEIPMRVISPEAENIELSGDGWKLVTGEEPNMPLAGLEELLNDREVK